MSTERLIYSPKAQIRAIQMTTVPIIGFCEGVNHDRHFYAEILRSMPNVKDFVLKTAIEICSGGGKAPLIALLRKFRKDNKLILNFKGDKKHLIFFFDKDADCFLRKKLRCHHAIYTKYYDVESHIFVNGNLKKSISVCLGIDGQTVDPIYNDSSSWCNSISVKFKQWISLCLFCQKYKCSSPYTYKRNSTINVPMNGGCDLNLYATAKADLFIRSGMTKNEFSSAFSDIERRVMALEKKHSLFSLLKGKWLGSVLECELKSKLHGQQNLIRSGFNSQIVSSLLTSLDYTSLWAEHFKSQINKVLSS